MCRPLSVTSAPPAAKRHPPEWRPARTNLRPFRVSDKRELGCDIHAGSECTLFAQSGRLESTLSSHFRSRQWPLHRDSHHSNPATLPHSGCCGRRMWVAACRQPASADPKRAGGNADLAVRHPGAFHRHSALSKTGGTDDTAVTTQLQQLLDASRQGARADRGAFLWNSTNSKPHQRRASSCRQKPSRSLRRCNRGAPSRRGHLRYRKRSRNPRHK
jgi:hypothetical protein